MGQMKAVLHHMAPGIPAIDLFADAPVGDPKASAYLLAAYAEWFAAGNRVSLRCRSRRRRNATASYSRGRRPVVRRPRQRLV
jgi:hypothetical protein